MFEISTWGLLQGGAPGRERVQLVYKSHITLGLMNGGYESILTVVYKATNKTVGAPPCMIYFMALNIGCPDIL